MLHRKEADIEWLEFELLAEFPNVVHASFLRRGGVSEGPFDSLNAGGNSGDSPEKIEQNRERMRQCLGLKKLFSENQTHGSNIRHICFDDEPTNDSWDGLITKDKGLGLMIKHADCQAAIFYDPVQHAIANVHCGWRGNVANIYAKTVERMGQSVGSRPENLLVCISPSLGPSSAEFVNYRTELPEEFWKYQVKPTYFDLWAISRVQLEEAGVLSHHIQIAEMCTLSNPDQFFSYRRRKISGRHATIAGIT